MIYNGPFRLGERVYCADDPRHIGRVIAVLWTSTVRVKWEESGWISDLAHDDVRRFQTLEDD